MDRLLEIQFSEELPEIEVVYVLHDECAQRGGLFPSAMLAVMLCAVFACLAYVVWQTASSIQAVVPPVVPYP